MSSLKEIVKRISEDAMGGSTGAGAIASAPSTFNFSGGVVLGSKKLKKNKFNKIRVRPMFSLIKKLGEAEAVSGNSTTISSPVSRSFDPNDVNSKFSAFQDKMKNVGNIKMFGIEDDDGHIIKLSVSADQADAFEKELGQILFKAMEGETYLEMAEVVYELSKKFNIVDADWGDSIVGDEEQEEVAPSEEEMPPEGEGGGDEGMPPEGEDVSGGEGMPPAGGEDDAKSALEKVIAMMKADAEARKAEADARRAEARAREAETTHRASEQQIKRQEEVLDMEDHYDSQKEQEKETQQLAQLAKYRHDKARSAQDMLGNSFENFSQRDYVVVSELADIILEKLMKR